jgi:DNA-binding NtrC family response regulator
MFPTRNPFGYLQSAVLRSSSIGTSGSTEERGVEMIHEFAGGNPAFVDFSRAETATDAGFATIATFPPPMGAGRTRGSRTALRDSSEPWIGESPEMLEVVERIRRIAPSLAAVMLVGESGTGKEGAARLLHTGSTRSSGPFVSVNCGAIPGNLVEAELFGYERGAFTGAVRQHQGYFERASGGTLFLDEITEMQLDLQAKLLRALEGGRLVRVGGTEEIAIDVRIVTATNRPTDEALRDRRLREDLFYRLAVFVVRLPALRERGDDLTLLAEAFLAQLNQTFGTAKRFDPAALASAKAYGWPGNVRELKNCVERSYVLSDDIVRLDVQPAPDASDPPDFGECVRLPIGTTMADAERELLLATLRHCRGNKRRAADVLGVSLKTVYNKLVGYGSATPLLRTAGEL